MELITLEGIDIMAEGIIADKDLTIDNAKVVCYHGHLKLVLGYQETFNSLY